MKKYNIREDTFDKIDTPEKAYWLGFIYADGCVSESNKKTMAMRLAIGLQASDRGHLEKFSKFMGEDIPVYVYMDRASPTAIVQINRDRVAKDLIKHGAIPRKTAHIRRPKLDSDLYSDFIRGYIDGDGSISVNKSAKTGADVCDIYICCGSAGFLEDVRDTLNEFAGINTRAKITNRGKYGFPGCYSMSLGGNIQTKKIISYLLRSGGPALERKYKKATELFRRLEARDVALLQPQLGT